MKRFKGWFYGRVEIPSRVWYLLTGIGAIIYIISIITSLMTNN